MRTGSSEGGGSLYISRAINSSIRILNSRAHARIAWGLLCAATACRLSTAPHPISGDKFAGRFLSRYSAYSDEGYPWSLGPNSLQGNGFGLQSVLIRKSVSLRDGWVETVVDSADDGGLVLRFADNHNYYLLAIRDDQAPFPRNIDNLQIYRRTGKGQGGFVSLWRMDVSWPRGVSHVIRFEVRGDRLTVYFDSHRVGVVDDAQHLPGLGTGIRHYGTSAAWITRYRRLSWGH